MLDILAVIGDAAAGAAQGEGGRMMAGRPTSQASMRRKRLFESSVPFAWARTMVARVFQPRLVHGVAEQLAVFGHFDGVALGADHLDADTFPDARSFQRQRSVQRRLAAHGRQQRVGAFFLDDLGDELGRDRLDIGGIGQSGSVMMVAGFELTRMTR